MTNIFFRAIVSVAVLLAAFGPADSSRRSKTASRRGRARRHLAAHNADPRRRLGGKGSSDSAPANTFKGLTEDRVLCRMYSAFDKVPSPQSDFCDEFQTLDLFMCPNVTQIKAICSHAHPYSDHGVSQAFCSPIFTKLPPPRDTKCAGFCTNFVQSGCCDWECE